MHFSTDKMTKYGIIATLAIAIAIPFLTDSMFILNLLVLMLIFIIFASAWNLLAYSGQGSLGHAAFFGIGAYASTLIAAKSGMSPFITIFLGAAVAAFIGILIGLTCVRLKEWFLAMVTFGFAIIVQTLTVSVLAPVTGGWDGIASPRLVSPSIPGLPADRVLRDPCHHHRFHRRDLVYHEITDRSCLSRNPRERTGSPGCRH